MLWIQIGTILGFEITQISSGGNLHEYLWKHSYNFGNLAAIGMLIFLVGAGFQFFTMHWHRRDLASSKQRKTISTIIQMVSISLVMVGLKGSSFSVYIDPQQSLFTDMVVLILMVPSGVISLGFLALFLFYSVEIFISASFPHVFDREPDALCIFRDF